MFSVAVNFEFNFSGIFSCWFELAVMTCLFTSFPILTSGKTSPFQTAPFLSLSHCLSDPGYDKPTTCNVTPFLTF
jgi:hypothetical protein